MANIITPLAFVKQVTGEGHQGIISTAGNSATGLAMAGICQTYNIPLIPIMIPEMDGYETIQWIWKELRNK